MRYGVSGRSYADFDRAADEALTESLRSHAPVDIVVLTDERVELCSIAVSVHDARPVEHLAPGARDPCLN